MKALFKKKQQAYEYRMSNYIEDHSGNHLAVALFIASTLLYLLIRSL